MFGYVTPVKSKLRQQDFVLYRAFYCGICAQIGRSYGSLPRFTTSYDITFLAILAHDLKRQETEFVEARCVGNPFRKKVMVKGNPLLERVCAANIILTYYKLVDDVTDGGDVKKRVARSALKRSYAKAAAALPEADEAMNRGYERLRALEKAGEKSIDRVADCFATMLCEIFAAITEIKDDKVAGLCYNIGKFVYLADALDDVDEDSASGNYNPFLLAYGDYDGRKSFYERHIDEIEFMLNSTVNRAIENFNGLDFTQSYTLLSDIVYDGLREKAKELLSSEKKLPDPKL